MSFADVIKTAAKNSLEASKPMTIMFGEVIEINPLTVWIENRLTVSGTMLVCPKELKAGYSDTHKHQISDEEWTNDDGNTLTQREYHYGLKVGDCVILLRDNGGQRFLVVGRL